MDSVQEVDNLMPLTTVLNCSGTGCSTYKKSKNPKFYFLSNSWEEALTNSSPSGIMTFISEDLAVMISVCNDSLLKNI